MNDARRLGRSEVVVPPRIAIWPATADAVWAPPDAVVTAACVLRELSWDWLAAGRPVLPCDAVVLTGVPADRLKGGRAYHRLSRLRDDGVCRAIVIDAADAIDAEWIVEHTPAHGVVVPYGRADMTARFRLLALAAELGVGVIARPAGGADIALADPGVTAVVLPDLAAPPADDLDAAWAAWTATHAEPPRVRAGPPPD